jgi:hypothetical protein
MDTSAKVLTELISDPLSSKQRLATCQVYSCYSRYTTARRCFRSQPGKGFVNLPHHDGWSAPAPIGIAAADRWRARQARYKPGKAICTMIRKLKSGQYRLYSRKKNRKTGGRRNLGTFGSKKAAQAHERAVQYFKPH